MTTVRFVGGPVADADRTAWNRLVAVDPLGSIFHEPRYLDLWFAELGGDAERSTALVERDGDVIGVVDALVTTDDDGRTLRFGGGSDVTDYLGPVCAPNDRVEVLEAWLAALASDGPQLDQIVLGGAVVATDDAPGWDADVVAAAVRAGFTVVASELDDVCPRVDLAGGHDGWLERLDGKQRQELKRKARKLARDAGGLELRRVPTNELDAALERFLTLAQTDPTEKGDFFRRPEMQRWFRALVAEFGPDGTLRIDELLVAGVPGAATVSFVAHGEWGLYNSAFDQGLARLGVGMVIVGELIRAATDEDLAVFDLLRGDEAYKYQFGAVDRTMREHRLVAG